VIADWWRHRSPKDQRTALISIVFVVVAVAGAILARNAFPAGIALLIGLTNLLGGTWSKRSRWWWFMVWAIAIASAVLSVGFVIWVENSPANLAAVVAVVANLIVIGIRRRLQD
jgi:CBS-domain-containing membrane protein